ncbi:hypothetical protein [Desulfonema magnum]|uniref:P-loop domain-containing protein n=1 Tax=Desulfonema magnum TaxID=45655 RepID=A0A975GKF5_9BACT|nr:hypothetical protein [Desulfonema magnum]QTA84465.1 p-loop domain-containing protein [Desulfonema magnum]
MKTKCIIVLGMHRSGTSAFTGVLSMLGVHLGSGFLKPTKENPKGYFENKHIVDINEGILRRLGTSWDDFLPLDENWWTDDSLRPFRNEIKKVVENELLVSEISGIKDPRLCRLIPFWIRVISELNIMPHFVITLRNPMEVAHSLKKRDGFSTEKSLLLWMTHMINAEYYTRGFPRIFCPFDRLISDSEEIVRHISSNLNLTFPKTYQDVEAHIRQFIDSSLKHHKYQVPDHSDPVSELVYDYFKLLNKKCVYTEESDGDILSSIDAVRKQFCDTQLYYYKVIKEIVKKNNTLKQSLEESDIEVKRRGDYNRELEQLLEETRDEAQRRGEYNWALEQLLEEARDEVKRRGDYNRKLEQLLEESRDEVQRRGDYSQDLEQLLEKTRAEVKRRGDYNQELQQALEESHAEMERRGDYNQELKQSLEECRADAEHLIAYNRELEQSLKKVRLDLQGQAEYNQKLERALEKTRSELERHKKIISEHAARVKAFEASFVCVNWIDRIAPFFVRNKRNE